VRIIHLTTEFPWPATSGGPVRTLSQLRMLASLPEVERITLLSVSERTVTEGECGALADAVPKLDVHTPVFHPIHLWKYPRYVPRVLALRMFGVPYLAAKWDSPVLRRTLRHELRDSSVDVVYVDHLGMARYLPDITAERPLSRIVLDQHNVESEFYKQLAESCSGLSKQIARAEWGTAVRFEKHVLETVDAVVAISRADADDFERVAGVRAHVVPVVVELKRQIRPHPGRPHFCYVGSLRWRPNVAGLDWLCQKVWPKIRARVPDATLEIAGVDLHPDTSGRLPVPDAWKVPGVETVGFVEKLEPLYDRSLGMLAPVLGGSGVRIKVLEGLRAGLPIVTTLDGTSGLPLTDGKEALIANDPDAFAERVERLVRDEDLRARLRDQGHAYLEKHHSPAVAPRALRPALGLSPGRRR
jgi:glycosyltransferase involved in cell wall biosynthesis